MNTALRPVIEVVDDKCVNCHACIDETGLGDYNVTLERIGRHLEEEKIDIRSFPEVEFDGPPAERATLFSSPGGLKATVERERPELYDSIRNLNEVIALLPELSRFTREQSVSLEDSTGRIEGLLESLNRSSGLSALRREELAGLVDMAGAVQTELGSSLSAIRQLKDQMHGVHDLVAQINKIATQTNLLSMNAAIEAAHAGDSGAGFAVVAAEIRNLADQADSSASRIAKTLSTMTRDMDSITVITESSGESIRSVLEKLASGATGMNEILDSLGAMSADAGGIADISHGNVRRMQSD
ncbi:MAG: methyl-accepting chemotaxis protein [Rectinemataceae bacterium]